MRSLQLVVVPLPRRSFAVLLLWPSCGESSATITLRTIPTSLYPLRAFHDSLVRHFKAQQSKLGVKKSPQAPSEWL